VTVSTVLTFVYLHHNGTMSNLLAKWLLSSADRDSWWTSVRCPLDVSHSQYGLCGRM